MWDSVKGREPYVGNHKDLLFLDCLGAVAIAGNYSSLFYSVKLVAANSFSCQNNANNAC